MILMQLPSECLKEFGGYAVLQKDKKNKINARNIFFINLIFTCTKRNI